MSEGPLANVVAQLDRSGIPHMLTGSFASTYHGQPRTTHDIDLVIDPTAHALERFVHDLNPQEYYVSNEAAREAWQSRGQFNLVHLGSGWKIALILCKDRAFSRTEFERRQPAKIFDVTVFIATAEDTILAKLEWAKAGKSERQLRDVMGILKMCGAELDRAYIRHWAAELAIEDHWQPVDIHLSEHLKPGHT